MNQSSQANGGTRPYIVYDFSYRWGENVFEFRPPTGLLFISQMIYEYGEPRWNDIDRKKPKNSENNPLQCQFVHSKYHLDPSANPGL
jgi:hypothetical protein